MPVLGDAGPEGIAFFAWFTYAALAFAAVLALVFLVIAGIRYVGAAGNAGGQTSAKEGIRNAVLGLILALGATLVLWTINPALTTIQIDSLVLPSPIIPTSVPVDDPVCAGSAGTLPTCADIRDGSVPETCPSPEEALGGSSSSGGAPGSGGSTTGTGGGGGGGGGGGAW